MDLKNAVKGGAVDPDLAAGLKPHCEKLGKSKVAVFLELNPRTLDRILDGKPCQPSTLIAARAALARMGDA